MSYIRSLIQNNSIQKRLLSASNYDLLVIGSGPGGYVASIKAAQLGMKVGCIEKNDTLGGTCLNVGCIPSKALLHTSEIYYSASIGKYNDEGILFDNLKLDLDRVMKKKSNVVSSLTKGIQMLFKANKVDHLVGFGKIQSSNEVLITDKNNVKSILKTKNIIVATGSEVVEFTDLKTDEKSILSSTGALSLSQVPKNMAVVGGGVIGLELGSVWQRFGCDVTIIEYLDTIGGVGIDLEISKLLLASLKKQGLKFILGHKVVGSKKASNSSISINIEEVQNSQNNKEITFEKMLVSIGRKPFTAGLGLQELGIKMDSKGFILVDKKFQTNVPGIYAIGDCTPGPMLAHKAEDEGIACVEGLSNLPIHIDYQCIPSVIYIHPEVAWVGSSEEQLKKDKITYKVGKFPIMANSRSKAIGESEGLIKILADSTNDRILGAHLMCTSAGELVNQMAMAMEYHASSEDIARVCHAHPTVSEALREACLAAYCGKSINNI